MKKRSFEHIINNLEESIMNSNWFVDFKKVIAQVDKIKDKLLLLRPLLFSNNILNDFKNIISKNNELIKIIPALIAFRDNKVKLVDRKLIDFSKDAIDESDIEDFVKFLDDTSFFEIIENKMITSLESYLVGVEVGLNTNARKNRSGKLMEDLVESFLQKADLTYQKQMLVSKIASKYDLQINKINAKEKRFDFVLEKDGKIYLIETNFFRSGGSKINAEATRFIKENEEIKEIFSNYNHIEFMWITDGKGLLTIRNDFKRAYDNIKNIFTIFDLKNNLFK